MSKKYIEKEVKFKVDDPKGLIGLLKSKSAEKVSGMFQRTTRMDTPNMDLEKKGIFLRVRTGDKSIVTLKKKINDKADSDLFERLELETEVKDTQVLADVFEQLGFSKRLVMEKYRVNYKYKNTTLSLDELPFGNYIEIEGEPKDISTVIKDLELNFSNRINVTYWDLFEEFKKGSGEVSENIVFPNNYEFKISSTDSGQK